MRPDPFSWSLYFIPAPAARRSLTETARLGLEGGARVVQLRLKGVSLDEWLSEARELKNVCGAFGRPLIINDLPDVAARIDADGLHVGQQDVPVRRARRLLGQGKVIGVTVFSPEDAMRAAGEGADYVAAGPVFASQVKEGLPPMGLSMISRIRRAVALPLFGIGGITAANAGQVIRAGADGVVVLSAISNAGDPRLEAARINAGAMAALEERRSVA